MAGSYRHITDSRGEFIGTDLLDHLGDAYEALEECWEMIQCLTGGDRKKIYDAWKKSRPKETRVCSLKEFWND